MVAVVVVVMVNGGEVDEVVEVPLRWLEGVVGPELLLLLQLVRDVPNVLFVGHFVWPLGAKLHPQTV